MGGAEVAVAGYRWPAGFARVGRRCVRLDVLRRAEEATRREWLTVRVF